MSSSAINYQIEIMKIIKKYLGKKDQITINCGIYSRLDGDASIEFLENKSDIVIIGDGENEITIDDIIKGYNKILKKCKDIEDSKYEGYSYFYEGIKYNSKNKFYYMYWGT
jgi:hypothetical protein